MPTAKRSIAGPRWAFIRIRRSWRVSRACLERASTMDSRTEGSVSKGSALVAALALLCVGIALLLWQRGMRAQRRIGTQRFVDRRLAAPLAAGAGFGAHRDGATSTFKAGAHAAGVAASAAPASSPS